MPIRRELAEDDVRSPSGVHPSAGHTKAANGWAAASAGFLLLLFALLYLPIIDRVADYGFWRHDSMRYLDSYQEKFATEGRWLNFTLHGLVVKIPPFVAWLISFAAVALFFLRVSGQLFAHPTQRLLVTTICMASATWYAQLNWPYYGLTSALLLLVASLLARSVSIWLLLPTISVLMFGGLQTYVYFLPLLYLSKLRDCQPREGLARLGRIVSAWALGFVLGYAIASLATWSAFGTGIRIPPWYRPDPATDPFELISNLLRNGQVLANQLPWLFPYWPWLLTGLVLASLLLRRRMRPDEPPLLPTALGLTLCLGIVVSHHVVAAQPGITIQYRSLPHVYIGVVFAVLYLSARVRRSSVVIGLLLVVVAVPSWIESYRHVSWFADQTQHMRQGVAKALAGAATSDGVVVDARQFQRYYAGVTEETGEPPRLRFETLGWDYRFARALTEEGIETVVFCPASWGEISPACEGVTRMPTPLHCQDESTSICALGTTDQGALVLRLQP